MPFFHSASWSTEDGERFPALASLVDATRNCTAETFWNFSAAFEEFFNSSFVSSFLAHELGRIARTADYEHVQSDDEIEVLRGENFRVSIGKIKAYSPLGNDHTEVVCYANDFVYANLGPIPLEFELLETPREQVNEVFDRSMVPYSVRICRQQRGETIKVRAGVDILKVSKPERDTYQIYAVSSHPRKSLLWHYDADTLVPKYCTAASLMSSRVQTAINILVRMGGQTTATTAAIASAAKSGDHFVRWSAIAAVTSLDPHMGLELLQTALADPHPYVKAAAQSALVKLQGEGGANRG
ncbi:MAG: HEAT repeat domain-containing protein [Rhizobiaceae bacterium]|nr:HEAT repeat domain-containing protein [Rhizobiaceae bacterium]